MILLTSRSKCLPQAEHSPQNHGLFVNSTEANLNYHSYQTEEQTIIQTPTTTIGFHQIPTWIKRDRLLSEANPLDQPHSVTAFTMTKTMDSFSDAHNNTMTANSMIGFDELMTPIIDQYDSKEKELDCTWIDSSHHNLNISKGNDFIAFDDTMLLTPTILNSPPESVKSISSNDDADCSNGLFVNNTETEKSFDFVDALQQPMKSSQDFLYEGPIAFQREIEQLSGDKIFYYNSEDDMDLIKNDDDMTIEKKTPILGDDLMLSKHQAPKCDFTYMNTAIKTEYQSEQPNEQNKMMDTNMNVLPMNAKLLVRRSKLRPQLQLKIEMSPTVVNNNTINIVEEKTPINLSTPQITNDVLEMMESVQHTEPQKFDLISYINAFDDEHPQTVEMVEANTQKQEYIVDAVSIQNIEQILPTPVASPYNKQCNNDDEIETENSSIDVPTPSNKRRASKRRAASRAIDFSPEYQSKRPRGRPPKTEPTVISPSEYKRLSPSDRRYMEMRLKNNEASRRSRLMRKGKEDALFDEMSKLMAINERLKVSDGEMDIEINRWKRALMKLAQI